ncbi:MAG: 3-deoxy-manno-octulosonate cytidylyltransferase [Gammaproteobacteria bacterium]|nr:3-deoxy-manno-octulosonate cytidylyltransferase [Gammaproteobacteria bacterium]
MYRIVIPSRYASTRLPGKPLIPLAGKPMLAWVYERALSCAAHEVIIATDDERIRVVAQAFGAAVEMTSAEHTSGTDRIAEVAARRGWGDHDVVVNLQGDEPSMPAELIEQVAMLLIDHSGADMATLATPIQHRDDYFDQNAVKVVTDLQGRALYFSRAPIPWFRDQVGPDDLDLLPTVARRHLGIYAYRVSALRRLAALAPTPLEQVEKLEQLRALAHGLCIQVGEATCRPGPDVNTLDDLARAATALERSAGTR